MVCTVVHTNVSLTIYDPSYIHILYDYIRIVQCTPWHWYKYVKQSYGISSWYFTILPNILLQQKPTHIHPNIYFLDVMLFTYGSNLFIFFFSFFYFVCFFNIHKQLNENQNDTNFNHNLSNFLFKLQFFIQNEQKKNRKRKTKNIKMNENENTI